MERETERESQKNGIRSWMSRRGNKERDGLRGDMINIYIYIYFLLYIYIYIYINYAYVEGRR